MKYYSEDGKLQYVLHFPGSVYARISPLFSFERDRVFKKDDRISIISVMNKPVWEESNIVKQCENSNIEIITSDKAMEVPAGKWYQPNKLDYIIECLDKTTTEFALILDAKDTYIVNDLDEEFINKFLSLDTEFCFNGGIHQFPKVIIEPIDVLLGTERMKFLNGGVVFGYTSHLKELYSFCKEIRDKEVDVESTVTRKEGSEQFFLRLALVLYKDGKYVKKGVDSGRLLFSAVHTYDYNIYENDEGDMIVDCGKVLNNVVI